MLISEKQHEANLSNAQNSTGPKTEEGKSRTRLNAQRYGLRARSLIIKGEDPAEFEQLYAEMEAEWQPRGREERRFLQQMANNEWLIARVGKAECQIFEADLPIEHQLALLDKVSIMRARLEHSYNTAMHELERLKRKPVLAEIQIPKSKPTVPQLEIEPQPHHLQPPAEAALATDSR